MAKVKIVQIALALSESESNSEYLDDKGRVWYQIRQLKPGVDAGKVKTAEDYEIVWVQLDLPDEPEDQDVPF